MDPTPENPRVPSRPNEGGHPEPELLASGEQIRESFPVEPGGTLFIDLDRGSIEVRSHPRNEVRIETRVSGMGAGLVHFSVESEGVDLWLDCVVQGWLHLLGMGAQVHVECWVPDVYAVDARTRGGRVRMRDIGGPLAVETSGGRIQVDGVDGSALLRCSGGRIEAAEIDGSLFARTSGGRVEVANVEGDVDVKTSGGRVEVFGAGGGVEATTSGGRVVASFTTSEPRGELRTSGGRIEVLLPADACCCLDARTSGAGVELDDHFACYDREKRSSNRVVAELNRGGETLKLRTSGGRILVRAR
jgi:hypothetical protein